MTQEAVMSEEPYEIVDYAELIRLAIREVEAASYDIPTERRAAVEEIIRRAEGMLAVARSKSAKELGFRLHDCKYPPPLMLWDERRNAHVCENCGHTQERPTATRVSNDTSWVRARNRRGGGDDGTGWMGS